MTGHTISKACSMCNGPLGSGANKMKKRRGFGLCHSCKVAGPDDEHRCQAETVKKKRCSKWRSKDSDYCQYHEGRLL